MTETPEVEAGKGESLVDVVADVLLEDGLCYSRFSAELIGRRILQELAKRGMV